MDSTASVNGGIPGELGRPTVVTVLTDHVWIRERMARWLDLAGVHRLGERLAAHVRHEERALPAHRAHPRTRRAPCPAAGSRRRGRDPSRPLVIDRGRNDGREPATAAPGLQTWVKTSIVVFLIGFFVLGLLAYAGPGADPRSPSEWSTPRARRSSPARTSAAARSSAATG